jgi:hypothetical protein
MITAITMNFTRCATHQRNLPTSKGLGACLVLLCLQTISFPVFAASPNLSQQQRHIPPFMTHNWLPTSLIFDIPSFNTRLLPLTKPFEIALQLTTANTFIDAEKDSEKLILDGEVAVAALSAQWRFSYNWQLNLFLPYIDHSSGQWDDLIEDWHNWFNLPQGGRQESTNNQFEYFYRKSEKNLLTDVSESGSEGDFRLALSKTMPYKQHDLVLHLELKAPTGKAEKLTGSGAWDVSTGIGWQLDSVMEAGIFSPFATVGVSYLGKTDLAIAAIQRRYVWSGRAGLHWHALSWMSLTVQLDSHSKIYNSNLKTLGGSSLQLTFGGHLFMADNIRMDLSIGEDLRTRVTPDFVVNMAMAYDF